VRAKDISGADAWYFLLVQKPKLNAFRKIQANDNFDLSHYGEILDSGFGDYAPKEVVEEINQKFKTSFA
jgi:hypothetical protein